MARGDGEGSVARQVLALQVLVVLLLVVIAVAVATYDARRDTRESARQQALVVARSVADAPTVREAVAAQEPTEVLQPYAEQVRLDTGTDYVVVMDLERTRFTHPETDRIGERFVGEVGDAPTGTPFTQEYTGTLGRSVRAVVPVRDGAEVVALVAVGISVERIDAALAETLPSIGLVAGAALLAGLAGAGLIARRLRRQTHGLGEQEITRMFEYYSAVLHAVREGLLLVDDELRVQLANDEASRLLALPPDVVGRPLESLGLPPALVRSVQDGSTEADHSYVLGQQVLVFSTAPARWAGRRVGAVVSVRDRTELQTVTGELDLVRDLSETLRAQNHEAANRLHTVVSLVETGRPDRAVAFATEELRLAQALTDEVVSSIADPVLAALLLGKTAQAAERGIELRVEGEVAEGSLPVPPRDLVSVVGNLVDNAFDAVAGDAGSPHRVVEVRLSADAREVVVEVDDSGAGIAPEDVDRVLERGWSTKSTSGRGLGLAIVAQTVSAHGGRLEVGRSPLGGTRFTVEVPG